VTGTANREGRVHAFTFRQGTGPWPDGLTVLHVYALGDVARSPGLAALMASCRRATAAEPLAHVGDDWLHVTLCQVTVQAPAIGAGRRATLAAAIGHAVAAVTPFTVTVTEPVRVPTGVICGIADGPLGRVRELVSEAARSVLGQAAIAGDSGVLHMSESYAYADADDARVDEELRAVRPRRATVPVDAVHLVDVSADQATKAISWVTLARIPLG
jgi:2'-5' RNA ligase superfamily